MFAATIRPSAAVYREEQGFDWWIYALLVAMFGLAIAGVVLRGHPQGQPPAQAWNLEIPIAVAIGVALPSVLTVGVLRMTTEVTPGDCHVWFGWIPTVRRVVPLESIERVEVVRIRPFLDYGGPGSRVGRDGQRALIARGTRGVRLHLADGTRLVIGSQRPEELADALDRARNLRR